MDKQNRQEDKVSDIANNVGSSTSEAVRQTITAVPAINPPAYLAQFYEGEVDTGNRALLRFYAKVYEDLGGRSL